MKSPKLLVIVGETASGKTALSLKLAQRFNGEIICADSSTVRRGLDIGSAKPTPEEQQLVPHHLLDVIESDGSFTAAVFKEKAQAAIIEIAARGRLPIMVGGTGLYVDSVLYDYGFRLPGDQEQRVELGELSTEELVSRVQALGLALDGVDRQNRHRLIRLIETGGAQPSRQPLRGQTLVVGLETEREVLKRRIVERVDAQLAAGLENEVRGLAERYGWDSPALRGIGYAQWRDYFAGADDLSATRQKIIKANNELAKRQRTWFRRNKSIHWISTPVNETEVDDLVTTFLTAKHS